MVKLCLSKNFTPTINASIKDQPKLVLCAPIINAVANFLKGEARTITTESLEPLRQQSLTRMARDESKTIYKQRKTIVEPLEGQLKNSGFRGFSWLNLIKVQGEFACRMYRTSFEKNS